MKDDWRYVGVGEDTWRLDRKCESPEDMIIAAIDGEEIPPPRVSGVDMIARLPEKRRHIIFLHIWEGMSFSKIADLYSVSKQAVHQQYQKGIEELKNFYPDLSSLLLDED